MNGELSPNGENQTRTNEKSNSNGGILSSADVSRAIFALSAAVDRLFEHAANTLHIEALLSFLQVSSYGVFLDWFLSGSILALFVDLDGRSFFVDLCDICFVYFVI